MARAVFYSFHYKLDSWRVQEVRNIRKLEAQPFLSASKWEEIKRSGDESVQRWIASQMSGKSCVVVLAGAHTAERRWVKYEIRKAWNDGKGVVVVRIHNLRDSNGYTCAKGANPLGKVSINGTPLSLAAKCYNPTGLTSKDVYNSISSYIEEWVEEAILIRKMYR